MHHIELNHNHNKINNNLFCYGIHYYYYYSNIIIWFLIVIMALLNYYNLLYCYISL